MTHRRRRTASAAATRVEPASATRIGRSRPRRSVNRPRSGLMTTSTRPALKNTAPIARVVQPASSSASGARTASVPKSSAGSVFSQRPPTKRRSANARRRPAAESGSHGAERPRTASPANANATTPTEMNEPRMPAASAIPPKSGPRIAPAIAAPNANPSISPRCSFGAALATHASAPAQVDGAREALDEPREPERDGAVGECEGDARDPEQDEPEHDSVLRAVTRGGEAARDASEEGARPERGEEQAGSGLREVELVGVVRDERRQRREEQRVDEDDRADEGDEPAHEARICAPAWLARGPKRHRAGGAFVRHSD